MAVSPSTEGPPNVPVRHINLVSLYSALAGMVSVNNIVPSSVIVDEISRSLSTTGERSTDSIPLILQTETPPTVSHVNTVDWFRKTVVFSGFFTNSERYNYSF